MSQTRNEAALVSMLEEVKRIRESLAEISESAQQVTKAIEGVLSDQIVVPQHGAGSGDEYSETFINDDCA